jgi:hypothetical protein
MDDDLMAAIDAQAERAEEARPDRFDIKVLAIELSERFQRMPVARLQNEIKAVFRERGLSWLE